MKVEINDSLVLSDSQQESDYGTTVKLLLGYKGDEEYDILISQDNWETIVKLVPIVTGWDV